MAKEFNFGGLALSLSSDRALVSTELTDAEGIHNISLRPIMLGLYNKRSKLRKEELISVIVFNE